LYRPETSLTVRTRHDGSAFDARARVGSIEREFLDADVADAAKTVPRLDVGKYRHLPELAARNGGTIEGVAPRASRPGKDAHFSCSVQSRLQRAAGLAFRVDGRSTVRCVAGHGTAGRGLSRLTVRRGRGQDAARDA